MALKYQDYLAANVLNEGTIVSYRMLSRAIKVHSNTAKEMLYEFHRIQNGRRASSIHATYLLVGAKKPTQPSQANGIRSKDGEDSYMAQAYMSSSMPEQEVVEEDIPITTVTLVAEEHLEATKSLYDHISSIHIYSLEPGPLNNIQLLADCNRKVAITYSQDDPMETWKQYGTIHNPNTKRRTTRPAIPAVIPAAPTTAAMKPQQQTVAAPTTTDRPPSRQGAEAAKADNKKTTTSKTAPLRRDSSNLFKSFAKTKLPAKDKATPDTSAAEDSPMKDAPSEGESETELSPGAAAAAQEKAELARQKRAEREAKLQSMMDDDDGDEDGDVTMADSPAIDLVSPEEAEEEGGETEAAAALDAPASKLEEPQQENITTTDGRRRGRRRVMKQRTTKDAEGYLVTKEEAVWESFSEEEPEAKRMKPVSAVKSSTAKAAGKGQGNIMSFFGKKG